MRVYYNGDTPDMALQACPAGHLPAAECLREWFEDDGTTPRVFPVRFEEGSAVVPHSLGKYLIGQRIARSTRIMLPEHMRRLIA